MASSKILYKLGAVALFGLITVFTLLLSIRTAHSLTSVKMKRRKDCGFNIVCSVFFTSFGYFLLAMWFYVIAKDPLDKSMDAIGGLGFLVYSCFSTITGFLAIIFFNELHTRGSRPILRRNLTVVILVFLSLAFYLLFIAKNLAVYAVLLAVFWAVEIAYVVFACCRLAGKLTVFSGEENSDEAKRLHDRVMRFCILYSIFASVGLVCYVGKWGKEQTSESFVLQVCSDISAFVIMLLFLFLIWPALKNCWDRNRIASVKAMSPRRRPKSIMPKNSMVRNPTRTPDKVNTLETDGSRIANP